jgi:hypothetical protein
MQEHQNRVRNDALRQLKKMGVISGPWLSMVIQLKDKGFTADEIVQKVLEKKQEREVGSTG